MAGESAVKQLVMRLSKFGILVAPGIGAEDLSGMAIDDLVARVVEMKAANPEISIVGVSEIKSIVEQVRVEKAPRPIEIIQKPEFKSEASEIDANYTIYKSEVESSSGSGVDDFVSYFRSRLTKIRGIIEQHRLINGMVGRIELLKAYSSGREVMIIGIIQNKITTKNGNIMAVVEDETADAKVIFMNGTSQQAKQLFEKARRLVNDEVISVKGKISGPFIIATEVIWPDVPICERKKIDEDIAIAFISDVHVGSRFFMEKNFSNFIKWTNGDHEMARPLASKLKYLIIGGDVVDGIGVYPNQDRELTILDIYAQYKVFFNFVEMIPEDIHVFIIPGNHDAVQRAEPQPQLTSDLIGDFKRENVHILPNPSALSIHGMRIQVYHGTSLDSVIRAVPDTTYANPEKPMIELLKRRHFSPIWGGNIIVPSRNDNLVIEKIPDILHMGHVHKNCIANYHGIDIINSGTWQSITDYQLMQGHVPSPCLVPVYEAKQNRFVELNFK